MDPFLPTNRVLGIDVDRLARGRVQAGRQRNTPAADGVAVGDDHRSPAASNWPKAVGTGAFECPLLIAGVPQSNGRVLPFHLPVARSTRR